MISRPAVLSKMWTSCFHPGTPSAAARSNASGIETPTMKRNHGKTTSARVIPSASGGRMWCIHDGAAGPRSLTKTMSRIVSPRRASTEATRPAGTGAVVGSMVIGIALFGFLCAALQERVNSDIERTRVHYSKSDRHDASP